MTHYLHSAPQESEISKMLDWLAKHHNEIIVLIDGAMLTADEREQFKLAGFNELWKEDHIFSNIGELGPLYIKFNILHNGYYPWLNDILHSYASELPLLSFIYIEQDYSEKWQDTLTWLADVYTEDRLAFFLRCFDTRTLSIIFNHESHFFTAEQQAKLCSGIKQIAWFDRFGRAQFYVIEAPQEALIHPNTLILNDEQIERLQAESLPDRIWAYLQQDKTQDTCTDASYFVAIQKQLAEMPQDLDHFSEQCALIAQNLSAQGMMS